jgi:hypothetical protein
MNQIVCGDQLVDYAKTIKSKEDFSYFLKCLIQDYKQNQNEWENSDLASYLEGINGFTSDMSGYYKNLGEDVDTREITWRLMAEILLAASVYGN